MIGTAARNGVARLRREVTIRSVRLASGLVLFAYVVTHLLNHALGHLSLGAMEAGLDANKALWRTAFGGALLYGALAIHAVLGLWSLYGRPRFQWTPPEVAQLVLGLALPPLLVGHVVSARLAWTLHETSGGYAQQLYKFAVASPDLGWSQAAALVVAWGHGCLGLHFWLRLKRGYGRAAPALLCLAVLLPVVALLGFAEGGRTVAALAAEESWRIENVPVGPEESPEVAAQLAGLAWWRSVILTGFAGAILIALGARLVRLALERRRGLVRVTYPHGPAVRVPRGTSVLEASRLNRIPHASVCNGRGRCSTCRVRVFGDGAERLAPPEPAEAAVLERVGAGPHVRLACQLRPMEDLKVAPLVAPSLAMVVARGAAAGFGEERFVVAMFVDMRGSTRLAEMRLPFDTVFLINRFLDAVARAVGAAGGAPNQFLGDGMLALFGLAAEPRDAARSALEAVAGIGAAVASLNEVMSSDLPEPIRFGIGLHGGTAVLGEIGGRDSGHSVFTAIGDPVNVAARLQGATKRFGVEALVSEAVYEAAGMTPDAPAHRVPIEGRDGAIDARAIVRAAELGIARVPA